MQLEMFRGPDLGHVVKQVRSVLGDDAMIVRTRAVKSGGRAAFEILAARPEEVEAFRRKLSGEFMPTHREGRNGRIRPHVIALVGPAGAGKTTTAMKLALHPRGLGGRAVGLLTLDTYRVGALEEIQTYAEIADLPLEAAYNPMDAHGALQRLRERDVIVVDTPGRGFGDGSTEWVKILEAIDPDEVHLVVPASFRPQVVRSLREALPGITPTHVLFSKLDECGVDEGLIGLVETADLPARWVSDGVEIPGGLGAASTRILAALGVSADEGTRRRRAG